MKELLEDNTLPSTAVIKPPNLHCHRDVFLGCVSSSADGTVDLPQENILLFDNEEDDSWLLSHNERDIFDDLEMLLPKIACSICDEEFDDQDLLCQHNIVHDPCYSPPPSEIVGNVKSPALVPTSDKMATDSSKSHSLNPEIPAETQGSNENCQIPVTFDTGCEWSNTLTSEACYSPQFVEIAAVSSELNPGIPTEPQESTENFDIPDVYNALYKWANTPNYETCNFPQMIDIATVTSASHSEFSLDTPVESQGSNDNYHISAMFDAVLELVNEPNPETCSSAQLVEIATASSESLSELNAETRVETQGSNENCHISAMYDAVLELANVPNSEICSSPQLVEIATASSESLSELNAETRVETQGSNEYYQIPEIYGAELELETTPDSEICYSPQLVEIATVTSASHSELNPDIPVETQGSNENYEISAMYDAVVDSMDAFNSEPWKIEEPAAEIRILATKTSELPSASFSKPRIRRYTPSACPKCDKLLGSKWTLTRHLKNNACQKKCIVCDKFMASRSWKKHILNCPKEMPTPVKCLPKKSMSSGCITVTRTPKACPESEESWAPTKKNHSKKNSSTEELQGKTSSKLKKRRRLNQSVHDDHVEDFKYFPEYSDCIFRKVHCAMCNIEFSKEKYFQHLARCIYTSPAINGSGKSFPLSAVCIPCGTQFSELRVIVQHDPFRCHALMQYVHENVKLRSPQEKEALTRGFFLTLHRLTPEDIKSYQTKSEDIPSKVMATPKMINVSRKETIKVDDIQCSQCKECKKYFASKSNLKQHERNESCKLVCPICFKSLSKPTINRHMLKLHQIVKAEKKDVRHACECGRDFEEEIHLKNHSSTCRIHKCPACGRGFNMLSYMLEHSRKCAVRVPPIENDLVCYWCGAVFLARWRYIKHCTDVHNIQERVCTLCRQVFASDAAINAHFIILKREIACNSAEVH